MVFPVDTNNVMFTPAVRMRIALWQKLLDQEANFQTNHHETKQM